MSASVSAESSETKSEISSETNRYNQKNNSLYALYLLSNKNRHASASETNDTEVHASTSDNPSENVEPTFCLSLLGGNLSADLETVVRCYILKSLSAHDSSNVENDGKYTVLHPSDLSEESVGCYYHRLSKRFDSTSKVEQSEEYVTKLHTFFICLIGPPSGIMESFCSELGTFCSSLSPMLDPQGLKDQDQIRLGPGKLLLNSWYFYCIEYISRCVQNFKDHLAQVLHSSLWGNVKILSSDEKTIWDLERLVEVCSLMPRYTDNRMDSDSNCLTLEVKDNKFLINNKIGTSQYCIRWYEKIKSCHSEDHLGLHSILESFRLKAIQDLNTLKRQIQKAVMDHYALFRAYQFLKTSGYSNVLLFHVKQEAVVAKETGMIDVIDCLQDFMKADSW